MASTTVDSPSDRPLQLDSIPEVDLRLLSQSELHSLSLCSDSAFDLRRCDDVVIPRIDRSVFNESAGSRKQTYSRLRLAPAASSSSTTTTIHRRTPHIRNHIPPSNKNDTEQAENSQIIHLLKELFKSDGNFNDFVPIEVECNNFVPPDLSVEYSNSVPDSSNLVNIVRKRKRGRPRKDERAMVRTVVVKREKRNDNKIFKKTDIHEEERDRVIVNNKGLAVDMAILEGLEDPYGPEIRRRTEGMVTEDELLGFLRGLNGLWGSRRKKKRIVDASDFGDALPKGWRISLSIKRKEGRVWLFCRRYISPSGRQFESCKEVSSYLVSIIGHQKLERPNYAQSNNCNEVAFKEACENAPDLVLQEDNKRDSLVNNSSSSVTYLSKNHDEQVTMKIADPMEVQVGELFKCLHCTMTFDGKDDLLNHQLSSHKTFNERNQYNGHIGTHVKDEIKNTESLPAEATGKDVQPVLMGEVPDKESLVQASVVEKSNVVTETNDGRSNEELKSDSPDSNHKACSNTDTCINKVVHELNSLGHDKQDLQVNGDGNILAEESSDKPGGNCVTNSDELRVTDEAPDVVAANSDLWAGYEAAMPVNENNSNPETSGETHVIDSVDHELEECFLEQERSSGSCLLSPIPNEQTSGGVVKDVVGISASFEVLTSNSYERTNGTANMDNVNISGTAHELSCDRENVINSESTSGFSNSRDWLAEDGATEDKQLSISEDHSLVASKGDPFGAAEEANGLISSTKVESDEKRSFVSNPSVDEDTQGVDRNLKKVSSGLICPKIDGKYGIGSKDCDSYAGSRVEAVTNLEEENCFKRCSSVSSWMKKACVNENNRNEVSVCTADNPMMQMNSESSLPLSGCEQNFRVEKNVAKITFKKSKEPTLNEFQTFRNSEPIVPVDCGQSQLNTGVMTINAESNLEFCSLVPSGSEQAFHLQDDVTGLYDSAMEECKQESSERGLLNQFCISETSEDLFVNKMYSTPLDGLKFDEDRAIGNHELSLAFGNPHAELYADTITVEHKKDLVNCSVVPSKIEHTFDVQTNLSMVNSSMVDDLKEGRGSMSDFFSLSRNSENIGFGNNVNTVYPGRAWEGLKVDDFGNSENKKFMFDFCSGHGQPDEDVMSCGMWKTAEGNAVRSGLADPSHPQVQSTNCFQAFNVMSEKAEDGLFRLGGKYNDESGVSGLRSSRSEPVEFSFLTTHNSNSFQGDAKVFSYGTEMEQEFDSSFWLGKNALMPNIAGRDQVTAICVWCRNEFHLQPVQSGSQSGIGSMCPTCTARISEQVNIL